MQRDNEEFDAVVVGSGAAGSWAAMDLAEAGLRVLMLDAGRQIDIARDYPDPEPGNAVRTRLSALLRGQHMQARNISYGQATRHFYVNDRENPYEVPAGAPFLWYRGRQVGGRLHTWGRSVLRMSDRELKASRERDEMGWPIGYADLAPYYDRVERTLGVHGNRDGLESVPDGVFIAPHDMNSAERLWAARLQGRTGLKLIHNRVVKHNPARIPIPIAIGLQTGRLTIWPNSVVSRVTIDERTGLARGVGYYHRLKKNYREVRGRVVILCASAFESVRLLLNSACRQHPRGLGGDSEVLGHYACDHVMLGQGGRLPGEYLDPLQKEAHGQAQRDPYDFGVYSMYLPSFCGTWGPKPQFVGGYGMQVGCSKSHWWALAFGEMVPRYENHVALSRTKKDAWGIPVARIDVRHGENEDRMAGHMSESLATIAEESGLRAQLGGEKAPRMPQRLLLSMLRRLVFSGNKSFWPGASIHETGGARMGSDPRTSVVNEFCQVWSAPNVFVTDGACFASSGFQNHTLSIMAITARTCDFIVREYAKGP